MISDEEIEKALVDLESMIIPLAQALADLNHCEQFRSSLEAILMKEFDDGSTSAVIQQRNARAHPTYIQHIDGTRDARFEYERLRNLRDQRQTKINVWQTMSANQRGRII
jgi:hypothetical protein